MKKKSRKGIPTEKYPITDVEIIRGLLEVPGRDGLLLNFMLYTAGRIGEIIPLRYIDVLTPTPKPKARDKIIINCTKQSKKKKKLVSREIPMQADLAGKIVAFWTSEGKPALDEYIFVSRRNSTGSHMGYQAANNAIKKWISNVSGMPKKDISTHMLRKTIAREYYNKMIRNGEDGLTRTMKLLRHASPATTMRYIGLTQEEINEGLKGDLYVTYKSLANRIKDGDVNIMEIWKTIKKKNPGGSPSQLKLELAKHFNKELPKEVKDVVDLFFPMLIKM
jgi:integrase